MVLNSSKRKLKLSQWLFSNQTEEFYYPLKLQKFLFFYEAFTKLDDDGANFSYLRAYKNGPVFSDVYGDYTHQKEVFLHEMENADFDAELNEERMKLAGFLVKILNEDELSDLTHELDAWKVKEREIGLYPNVSMYERDFSSQDFHLLSMLREMYPMELINRLEVISIGDKNFLISKKDMDRLGEEQDGILMNLSDQEGLHNPVYVSVDEDGVLMID